MAAQHPSARLLVTGASGQLGQLVLRHLLDTLKIDATRVVAGSRDPTKLSEFAARGVHTYRLDFDDVASVEAAAQNVDRVLLISSARLSRTDDHANAIAALIAAGVKHILYTSLQNAENSKAAFAVRHFATEQLLRASKVQGYTVLRNGLYFENDLGSIAGAKHTGKWFSAARDGQLAAMARDDVALVDAIALASNDYENRIYSFSGMTGLTVDEIVANVGKAIARPIDVVHVSVETLAQRIAAATSLPADHSLAIASLDTNTADGLAGPQGSDFRSLVGRDPVSHEAWLAANKGLLDAL